RRRHTISYGDWSSDVCSSDLNRRIPLDHIVHAQSSGWNKNQIGLADIVERQVRSNLNFSVTLNGPPIGRGRSHVEARSATGPGKDRKSGRVGKEGGCGAGQW